MIRRALGIDPGSRKTGYGVVELHGSRLVWIASGTISTGKGTFQERLVRIYDGLREVVETYSPTDAAIESIYFSKNAASALKLGQARGVAMLAVVKAGLALSEYEPSIVKKAVVGYGGAEKGQVQTMVGALLGRRAFSSHDESDALAVTICHLNHIQGATRRPTRRTR